MKKVLTCLLTLIMCLVAVFTVGCKSDNGKIVIAVPDGAPTLALYSVMSDVNSLEGYAIEYKVLSGAENIGKTLVSGAADCAVMPVNVAAKLYNSGNDIKLLSVNVFGVLYMVGKTPYKDMSELKGKVVATIGKGATPDISLKKILDGNGVGYTDADTAVDGKVAISYVADAPTAMKSLAAGKADYAILGEPQATVASKNLGVVTVMDIQAEWQKLVGNDTFTQAGFVMNKNVYENTALVNKLFDKLSENTEKIMKSPEKVKKTVQKFGSSIQVDFTAEILSRCNLGCKAAKDIKGALSSYFAAICDYDPTFIGGKAPDDAFCFAL